MLPILLAVWVNLHGGVLAGAGLIGIWIVVRLVLRPAADARRLERYRETCIRLALVGFACGLALLVNPYGADLVGFLLRTATVPRPEISEWAPLQLMSIPGQVYLVLLAIGISALVWSGRRREPETIAIFGVAALLPLIANRHYPLFALTLVVLGGEHVADVWNRWWQPTRFRFGQSRWTAVVSVLVSLVLFGLSLPRFGCIRVDPFYFTFPARAVALLQQSGVRGNMAVPFDWGEYVIWHLGPGIKVSIDGRRETVYSDEMLSAVARLRERDRGLGCIAQDRADGPGPAPDRLADGQLVEPDCRVGSALQGHMLCPLRARGVPGSRPDLAKSDPVPS